MKGFIITGLLLYCTSLYCTSCASVVEKGGQFLDGSLFAEKTRSRYRLVVVGKADPALEVRQVYVKKDKEEALVITLEAFPMVRFRGSLPAEDGSFQLQGMYFLGGSLSGWNEFTLEIIGEGVFTVQDTRGVLHIQPAIEPVQITSGKIRHKGNRLVGDQALTSLRNRQERIKVLTKWMHTQQDLPRFEKQEAFEAYWKPLILPELVSAEYRPPAFTQVNPVWVRAEDIKWNTGYTEFFFPEELWALRNSGALARDWEEMTAWIYVQYQWDYIVQLMSDRYTLRKIN